jgi:transposase-like protein
MISEIRSRLSFQCPYIGCSSRDRDDPSRVSGPRSRSIVRKGAYFRSSDHRRIARFYCGLCRRTFSSATFSPAFRQKKRRLNHPLGLLLASNVSQRRAAELLGINRKTVARKLPFLGIQCRLKEEARMKRLPDGCLRDLQFDEMQSFERSKCLPLSIPLLVHSKTRQILGFSVASMPASGLLASLSRKRYGRRADQRQERAQAVLRSVGRLIHPQAKILTDKNPHYGEWIRKSLPPGSSSRNCRGTPGMRRRTRRA